MAASIKEILKFSNSSNFLSFPSILIKFDQKTLLVKLSVTLFENVVFPFTIEENFAYKNILNNAYWPTKWTLANSADPDQTPHHAASDQGLHC